MDAIKFVELIGKYCESIYPNCKKCNFYASRGDCRRGFQLTKEDVKMLEAWNKEMEG